MKNARYFNGHAMPYAWSNLIFIGDDVDVVTIQDIIEDCKNGTELVKELGKLNMVRNKWVVDRETDEKVRIKNVDTLGNVQYIECSL